MTATDLAIVLLGVVCLAVAGAIVVMMHQLTSTIADLRRTVTRLEDEALPAVARMAEQSDEIAADLVRVDGLVDKAERVSSRAEVLSKVTYHAVARPVINTAAVVKGTSRAARRLRRGDDDSVA